MEHNFEDTFRVQLPSDGFTVIRLDGVGFSRYTKHMDKPFDADFTATMITTAKYLAENVPSTILTYTQSDEISLILDHRGPKTEPWYGNVLAKITSITAAWASVKFQYHSEGNPIFDSRAFWLPDEDAVMDYLANRQGNAKVNAISMIAQTCASHKELMGLGTRERTRLIFERLDKTPDDYPRTNLYGAVIRRTERPHVGEIIGSDGLVHEVDAIRKGTTFETAPRFSHITFEDTMAPVILEPIDRTS